MKLSTDELTSLIRNSSNANIISGSFGPGGVELTPSPTNDWAREFVGKMRRSAKIFEATNKIDGIENRSLRGLTDSDKVAYYQELSNAYQERLMACRAAG